MRALLRSFGYAIQGGVTLFRTQRNARIHLAATVAVIAAGIFSRLAVMEWIAIVLSCGGVWLAEAFNTALEFLCDELTRERRTGIKRAKDVAAFAVLVAAVSAACVGVLVFGPRLAGLF